MRIRLISIPWVGAMSAIVAMTVGLLCEQRANAAPISFSFDNINQPVPDGSAIGFSDRRVINTPFTSILDVTITLTISGGFNGDLYAQITHDSGFAVLLNRVGKSTNNEFGYGDAGFSITLDDNAPSGDVHVYRTTLFGNENMPVSGGLSGTWAPDGRTTDPDLVLNTDSRSAFLSSFNGVNPNGTWTLFIADTSAGAQSTVQSWGLQAEGVPEPGSVGLLIVGMLTFLTRRSISRRR